MSDTQLLAQLANERQHVLRTVDGLAEDAMHRAIVPSGWTMTRLLNHLAFDDEMFGFRLFSAVTRERSQHFTTAGHRIQ